VVLSTSICVLITHNKNYVEVALFRDINAFLNQVLCALILGHVNVIKILCSILLGWSGVFL